jgi:arsenite methyltransferase
VGVFFHSGGWVLCSLDTHDHIARAICRDALADRERLRMLEIGRFVTASAEELEGLSYYEMIARLGLLSFNSQGCRPMDLIAQDAGITSSSTVLVAGCGTGGTAAHLAETTGASVHGLDLSPESVRIARERTAASPACANLSFSVGDAGDLKYAADSFDAVVCEYVAFFLPPSSFEGFRRVLKPGGLIALAEMMKDPGVGRKADAAILAAEASYSDLVGYPFHLPTIDNYLEILAEAGFEDVRVRQRFVEPGIRESARNLGGWKEIFRISWATLKLMMESPILRKRFMQAGRVKDTLTRNKSTAHYVFQGLITGRKPA